MHPDASAPGADQSPMNEMWPSVEGHLVHGVEWRGGSTSSAPTVVLVHGLGGSTVNWELVGTDLARRLATRVVAFDLAGFGHTALGSRRATLADNGRLLMGLVADLGPVVLVGNSMG